jgi:predicted alpha/beta superfamily hydrolase
MFLGWLFSACTRPAGELTREDVYAAPLDTTYELSVYTPLDAPTGPGARWVLLLDGDVWIEEAAVQLDGAVARGEADPVVLVGIGKQSTRSRDYTPWPSDGVPEASAGSSGEIEAFFGWLVEWVPAFEAERGLGGDRSLRGLAGHSYGGLATAWALFHANPTWARYGVVSPSLWWDDGVAFTWEADLEGAEVAVVYGALEEATVLSLADAFAADLAARRDVRASERVVAGDDHYTVAVRHAWAEVFRAW